MIGNYRLMYKLFKLLCATLWNHSETINYDRLVFYKYVEDYWWETVEIFASIDAYLYLFNQLTR